MSNFSRFMSHEPERASSDRTLDCSPGVGAATHSGDSSLGSAGISAHPLRPCSLSGSSKETHPGEQSGRSPLSLRQRHYRVDSTHSTSRNKEPGSTIFAPRLGRQGFLALGGAITLIVFLIGAGFGLSMVHIRAIAQRQITLDRCAGSAAHLLRHLLEDLTASNQRIEVARLATIPLLPTPSGPAALEVFKTLLRVESMIQKEIQKVWGERQLRWNQFPGVGGGLRDRPYRSPFPDFSFEVIQPEDSVLETQSSSFLANPPKEIRLGISIARLNTEALLKSEKHHAWSVRWSR